MRNNFLNLVAKIPQNTGGGTSRTKNRSVTVNLSSDTTTNREKTERRPREDRETFVLRSSLLGTLKYVACMLLALVLGIGQMWANNTTLVSGYTLPDLPTATLDVGAQTADVNGYVVYLPYASKARTQSWASQENGGTGSASSAANAPFTATSSVTHCKVRSTARTYAVQFTGATDVLINGKSGSGQSLYLDVYEVKAGVLQTTRIDRKSCTNSETVLTVGGLTASNTYVAYIYYTTTSDGGWLYGIAFRQPISTAPAAPSITAPASTPDLAEISLGETKQFSVTATGYPAPTYAWYSCEDGEKTNPEVISGVTTASYTTPNTLAVGTYYYYCVVTNENGTAISPVFSLKVNPLGADLTAHTPGIYTSIGTGGYGKTLKTIEGRDYEVYMFNSSTLRAGSSLTISDGLEMLTVEDGKEKKDAKEGWIKIKAGGSGAGSGKIQTNEFSVTSETENDQKVHYVPFQSGEYVRMKVSGYDQFSFVGKDNHASTEGKQFVVKIDGVTKSYTHNATDNTIFRFDISTDEHTIEITGNGANDNRFRGFSLRLPACAATAPGNISKGALSAGVLTLNVAEDPATGNKYYWQTSATGTTKNDDGVNKNEGKSFNVKTAGTYHVRSYYADEDCWSAAKSFEVKATDLVENYTVIYKDGETELKRVPVEVGQTPEAYTPTKDFYTFARWSTDPSTLGSTAANAEVTLTAVWTPNYAFGAYSFNALTVGTSPAKTINGNEEVYDDPFRVDNFYFDGGIKIQGEVGTDAEGLALDNFKGWKLKTTGKNIKFLVENNCLVKVAVGSANTLKVIYTALDGTEKNVNLAQQTETPYLVKGGTIVTLQTTTNSTITLKRIEISALYDATLTDTKSDGSAPKTSVTEVTLPTPTAISGWTFTGWVANADVKAGEDTKTAGTVLAAGAYTLLANTTFTAQWVEASATYDITYSSAHGTAPDAENAASVVLAELSADGWAHKGWTANADVTVDAATVNAGDLIENGKTVILAGDVTFTAVWKEIFTVTFDSKDGSAVAPVDVEDGASLAAAPTAPTKDNYVFLGWSETDGGSVVADITTLTIGEDKTLYAKWALDVQVSEIVFSNSFKGWINGSNITVFYMAGESAPTITSYAGKNLKAEGGVVISGDKIIATATDDSELEFDLTMTEVTPLTTTGAKQTFDGSETYVKSAYGWKWHETDASKQKGWAFQKLANDGRIARGLTREYFFFGPAESATFSWKVAKKNSGDPAVAYVYVDGVLTNTVTSTTDAVVVPLKNTKSIVAFESAQTNGDCGLMDVTLAPWVPVTAVALKEGDDPISSKTIWESTSFTLTAEVTPDNASNKTITWTSSNEAVATVENGVVTGVAASADPVTITASTVDGVSATCVVTVTAAPAPCETPTINTQPATQAYCAGSEPTLTVDAGVTDGGTLHYAWFKDDAAIGSDAATCLVDGAGTYKVVVTNHVDGKLDASVTSDNAVITLNVAAAITTQPTNKSEIVSGSSVTLSLVATNATSYQWYSCDDAEKTNAAAISGAGAADYVFTCTANGYYYCEVGNACGAAVVSNVVSVKLEPEGCNTLASIPSASPYQYEQTGEWTLYAVTTKGKFDDSQKFKNNVKDFEDNTVNAIEYTRIGMTFAKDVESLTFYATASSTGRTINGIKVTTDDITISTDPTYTDVTASLASTTMPGQTKQYIFTADNMLLEAGKKYWITFSGTVDIFKICYTEALARPVIPTLSNQELCSGESYAEIDATSTKTGEGTLSYQWYDATDEEHPVVIDGANSATFTPTADGKYYVEVTNAAAGHVSNKAKSNTINVAHFAATEITTAPENQRKDAGQEATLTVVASGKNLHYAWKESATIDGTYTDVAGATDAASLTVEVTAGMDKYYKVVVSSDCGSAVEAIARVEEWTELPQVAVSANTTWDMANVADAAINLKDDFDPSRQNERLLLANLKGVNNNATFNAQALMFEGQHIGRTSNNVKHLAGRYLQFNVTVPGVVFVTFASNGDNQRTIRINASKCAETTNDGAYITFAAAVNPGSVEIMGIQDESENQYVRISKVVFKTTPDYKRDASTGDDWMAPGELGTICIPNGAVAVGGDLYTLEGKNSDGKIVFATADNNRMKPGVPYLFQATSNSMKFYYTEETAVSDPVNTGAMKGSFTNYTLTEGLENIYYFNGHALWSCASLDHLDVVANRAFVDMNAVGTASPNPAPGRRYIYMGVHGQNTATGMDELNASEAPVKVMIDGQLFIIRGEKMYNANGQLVK